MRPARFPPAPGRVARWLAFSWPCSQIADFVERVRQAVAVQEREAARIQRLWDAPTVSELHEIAAILDEEGSTIGAPPSPTFSDADLGRRGYVRMDRPEFDTTWPPFDADPEIDAALRSWLEPKPRA